MMLQVLKSLFLFLIFFLFLGSMLTTAIWYTYDNNNLEPYRPPRQKKGPLQPSKLCKGCREVIDRVATLYAEPWKKNKYNDQKFNSQLSSQCRGFERAIVTQSSTPVGTTIVYGWESQKTIEVTPELFYMFVKEHPFSKQKWNTCAVVGNGGILLDSKCGKKIDSADFVIRCNLAPLENGYEKDVGIKTDLVTANPSILERMYGSLTRYRRAFVESLDIYGKALLLCNAFSFASHTDICLRAAYAIEDAESPIRPIFFNPKYLRSLGPFWSTEGLKEPRLSTGMIVVSMALELCANVDLYGFWPFSVHPYGFYALTNHYYDDRKAKKLHRMPAEFDTLLKLHSRGVLRLHLGQCKPDEQ